MDDIIIRVLNGKAEPIEELRLDNWRGESSQNEQYFREVSAIWQWSGTDSPSNDSPTNDSGSVPPPPSVEAIVRQAEALSRQKIRRRFARGIGRKEIRPWAAVAAIAAVSLGVWIGRMGPVPNEVMGTEYVAGSSEAVTVALADGSFIRLAPGSRVRFAEHAELREAWLTGRGFFGVESDAERPFVVHTDAGDTRVLGTRFEVTNGDAELRVIVVEGLVAVTSTNGRSAEVSRGQVARLGTNGDFSVETVENVYDLLDWPGGILLFQSTPLPQVVEEISAHFGVTIQLDDPALSRRTVTAWFGDETLDEVVESVCLLVQADCEVDPAGVRIGG